MEQWRPIDGFPDYAVSSEGRVMRVSPGKSTKPGRIVKPYTGKTGYSFVSLSCGSRGNVKLRKVHLLVADAFLPPDPSRPYVNHISAVKTENAVRNLERCTQAENAAHAKRMGLVASGERHRSTRYTDATIRCVRAEVARGDTHAAVAARHGMTRSNVGVICSGKSRASA